ASTGQPAESHPLGPPQVRRTGERARASPTGFRSFCRTPVAAPQDFAEAQYAVTRIERDDDQKKPKPELPSRRIDACQEMFECQIGHSADERTVKATIAAQDQNNQHGCGAVEIKRA